MLKSGVIAFLFIQIIFVRSAVIDDLQTATLNSLSNGAQLAPNNIGGLTTTNMLNTLQNTADQLIDGDQLVDSLDAKAVTNNILQANPVENIPPLKKVQNDFQNTAEGVTETAQAMPNIFDGQIFGKNYGLNMINGKGLNNMMGSSHLKSLMQGVNDGMVNDKNNYIPPMIGGIPLQTRSYGGSYGYGGGFDEDDFDDDDDDFMTRSKLKKKKKKKKCGGGYGGFGGGYGGY